MDYLTSIYINTVHQSLTIDCQLLSQPPFPHFEKYWPERGVAIGSVIYYHCYNGVVMREIFKVGAVAQIAAAVSPRKIFFGIASINKIFKA